MTPDFSEYYIDSDRKERFTPFALTGKYSVKKLELHQDKDGYHYLSAIYEIRNNNDVYELNIPYIELPIRCEPIISRSQIYERGRICCNTKSYVNLGFGDLDIKRIDGIDFTLKTLTEELTLEEIEKRLGYKVKIVSKK